MDIEPSASSEKNPQTLNLFWRGFLLLACLYLFLVGIGGMGASFKLFGQEVSQNLIEATASPITGLFIGILATALVQSSSTTTSMVVAVVAAGGLTLQGAIPIIMGANIGTAVTCTLVSLGHIGQKNEFRRAFAAACLHDWFNLLAVAILFPLELATGILSRLATVLSDVFANAGGLQLANPLKVMTEPAVATLSTLVGGQPILLLLLSVALMVGMLICLVKLLRLLIEARIKAMLDDYIFRNAATAMGVGLVFTLLVQSSSVTTSLMIPLAATGVLSLAQVFPYVIGANFGTTCTAMLAAMATGNPAAVTVAFPHFLFNISGALCIWPWPKVRAIPVRLAEWLADKAMGNRLVPIVFILVVFLIVPLIFTWGRFREAFAG